MNTYSILSGPVSPRDHGDWRNPWSSGMLVNPSGLADSMAGIGRQPSEKFTLPLDAARNKAREIINQAAPSRLVSVVENWRQLPDGQIEFTVFRPRVDAPQSRAGAVCFRGKADIDITKCAFTSLAANQRNADVALSRGRIPYPQCPQPFAPPSIRQTGTPRIQNYLVVFLGTSESKSQ